MRQERSTGLLIAPRLTPRFASNYVKNFIAYGGAVLWNAIIRSSGSSLDCTDTKSFLKKVVKCCTFRDFYFVYKERLYVSMSRLRIENFDLTSTHACVPISNAW